MDRTPVVSSNVKAIGYDPVDSVLEVKFNSGAVYQYRDVPEEVYNDFMIASSKGKFLWNHIRDVYEYERIS